MTTELIVPTKPKGFKKMSQVFGNGRNTNSRNSREIHKYLRVKTRYNDWITRTISKFGFEENIDFTVLKNEYDSFTEIDYIVTDDMAKHLGMIEKNQKGKEVRNYFIYMEKLAKYLIMKTCSQSQVQLQEAQGQIKKLQVKRLKTYKDGFMSLRKYLKDNNIAVSEETAWDMLTDFLVVEKQDVMIQKKFLIDESFGRQEGDAVIQFNSRSLDYIFSGYVKIEPTLF